MKEQKVRLSPNTQFRPGHKGIARLSIQKSQVRTDMAILALRVCRFRKARSVRTWLFWHCAFVDSEKPGPYGNVHRGQRLQWRPRYRRKSRDSLAHDGSKVPPI